MASSRPRISTCAYSQIPARGGVNRATNYGHAAHNVVADTVRGSAVGERRRDV